MARPARKVEDPNIEGQDDTNTQALDEASQEGQTLRTGQVSEGELDLARSVAKRMGWTPKEDWKRDPSKWVDAPDFLENTPRELDTLKERNRRTAQAAADAIADSDRRARVDAEARVRAAAEAQDPDAAVEAAGQLAKVSGLPPVVTAWLARNEWMKEDPAARAVAVSVTDRLANQGASMADQLEAAETEVRKRFPEHFGQAERPEPKEVPLRESRHITTPPAVQAGTRGADVRTREKGFADIPAGDRALYQRHFAKRFEQTMKPDDAQKRYAASYWANRGEA